VIQNSRLDGTYIYTNESASTAGNMSPVATAALVHCSDLHSTRWTVDVLVNFD